MSENFEPYAGYVSFPEGWGPTAILSYLLARPHVHQWSILDQANKVRTFIRSTKPDDAGPVPIINPHVQAWHRSNNPECPMLVDEDLDQGFDRPIGPQTVNPVPGWEELRLA